MIRLSRLADYAVLLMSHMAREERSVHNAIDMAAVTRLPAPTVSSVLATLARAGLLASIRGRNGGYRLARPACEISAESVIAAMDGPIALTLCAAEAPNQCDVEDCCPSRAGLQRLNRAIRHALSDISLAELAATDVPPISAAAPRLDLTTY